MQKSLLIEKIKTHKAIIKRIFIGFIIISIILLNIFGIRFAFDLIIITFGVFALIRGESSEFIKDWFFPIILFFLYEFLRGHAYAWNVSVFDSDIIISGLIRTEEMLFFWLKDIPPVYLQQTLRPNLSQLHLHDYILFFFYISFFWYWLLVGFILWIKKRQYFKPYIYGLLGFSLVSVILFFLFPSAPPWYASETGYLPYLERILWTSKYLPSGTIELVSTYGRNDFAAMPSHHAAWPFFATLFLVKAFGRKALFMFIFPFMIAFATWYGAEHYVIDSFVGFLMASITFIVVLKLQKKGVLFKYKSQKASKTS